MSADSSTYYIVHSRDGRIVAVAPVDVTASTRSGVHLRWRPVAAPDHVVSEIPLTDEHAALLTSSTLADFEVDVRANRPQLRRRPAG